jgi:hypothetical protein
MLHRNRAKHCVHMLDATSKRCGQKDLQLAGEYNFSGVRCLGIALVAVAEMEQILTSSII